MLAAVFAFAAMPKLAGAHSAVAMFGQIGAGQWLRYLVGTAELAGAVGLLIPRLAGLAAAGLAADMAGASIINIAVLHSAAVALTIPLCAASRSSPGPLGAHHQAPGRAHRAVTRPDTLQTAAAHRCCAPGPAAVSRGPRRPAIQASPRRTR